MNELYHIFHILQGVKKGPISFDQGNYRKLEQVEIRFSHDHKIVRYAKFWVIDASHVMPASFMYVLITIKIDSPIPAAGLMMMRMLLFFFMAIIFIF